MKNNGKKNGIKKSHLELISEGLDKFGLNLADLIWKLLSGDG